MEIKPTVNRMNPDPGAKIATEQTTNKMNNGAAASAGNTASNNSAADLTLTDTARNLLGLQNTLGNIDDIDLAKVDAIRQSIEDGTYEVDSAKLADNLIQSSLELP